jgi:apolipoprotein N-acyltransferase
MTATKPPANPLSLRKALLFAAGAAAAFHLAYSFAALGILIVAYLFCLLQLARVRTERQAFYSGLATGLLCAGPQLYFFWIIFGPGAIALWLIWSFWLGMFVLLARFSLVRFGPIRAAVLAPFLWTGLEYFRSELYYLRFSWLSAGCVFSGNLPAPVFHLVGLYGIGFLAMALAAFLSILRPLKMPWLAGVIAAVWAGIFVSSRNIVPMPASDGKVVLTVAGVQLEFPTDGQVVSGLNTLMKKAPEAELLVLSEYTFDGPVPGKVRAWCRDHHRYLIVGGKDPAPNNDFYDTAFVIDPNGEIVFRQVKSVPVQFFKDGLPAPEQQLWESPWGKIGMCVCYDLSYARVADRLVKMGAQALIVPTMDVVDWGGHERRLHGLVGPVRAAEYGVPVLRVSSSGISQLVNSLGQVQASAGFPGQGEMITGHLDFAGQGSLPFDRTLAPFSTGVAALVMIWFALDNFIRRRSHD